MPKKMIFLLKKFTCYLDLVAISIACDIVHITGENRVLAHFGLQKINNEPCIGVKTLMEVAGRTGNYAHLGCRFCTRSAY